MKLWATVAVLTLIAVLALPVGLAAQDTSSQDTNSVRHQNENSTAQPPTAGEQSSPPQDQSSTMPTKSEMGDTNSVRHQNENSTAQPPTAGEQSSPPQDQYSTMPDKSEKGDSNSVRHQNESSTAQPPTQSQ